MAALYGDECAFRSHDAQEQPCLPPDVHAKMILTQPSPDWSCQLREGVPSYSPHNHHQQQHQEQYHLGNQLYYYQRFQIEQQRQQQHQQELQFQYQSYPSQHQYQQSSFDFRNKPNDQGERRPQRLALPRLDTSFPAVRPLTQPTKKPRYYANFPISTSASSTTSTTPLSLREKCQTFSEGSCHRASFSAFPEPESASSFHSDPIPPASAAPILPTPTPSSSEPVLPKQTNQIDSAPSRPAKAAKSRTPFEVLAYIVSSSRKERSVAKEQKLVVPHPPDASAVIHVKKEPKRTQAVFALLEGLVSKDK
ncbi:hypothetical protein ACJ73_01756 [Blastomyces percursus]|uniref:Uncharacterized protein n=1 Tax=Blastomyces percursus TaxID=1658174 RepID=A0A1J9QDG3_9EURO|nr:hypothetical protein ACJ73_01756 [Blastomyces percursus]